MQMNRKQQNYNTVQQPQKPAPRKAKGQYVRSISEKTLKKNHFDRTTDSQEVGKRVERTMRTPPPPTVFPKGRE